MVKVPPKEPFPLLLNLVPTTSAGTDLLPRLGFLAIINELTLSFPCSFLVFSFLFNPRFSQNFFFCGGPRPLPHLFELGTRSCSELTLHRDTSRRPFCRESWRFFTSS